MFESFITKYGVQGLALFSWATQQGWSVEEGGERLDLRVQDGR